MPPSAFLQPAQPELSGSALRAPWATAISAEERRVQLSGARTDRNYLIAAER